MKNTLKNQTAKIQNQTSKIKQLTKDLKNDNLNKTKTSSLFDFIKNQLGGIELTPEQMQEFEPERPSVNYSMFTLNPDEQYQYNF